MAGMGMGFEGMLDTVEFVRKTWSQLNLPTAFAPTMDLGEIDKRITDLKAVEQWLVVNLSMLRTTIQAVEMQRSAIATMQAFGQAMTAPAQGQPPAQAAAPSRAQPEPDRGPAPAWPNLFGGTVASDLRDPMDSGGLFAPPVPPSAVRPDALPGAAQADASAGAAGSAESQPSPMLDPTAWWNLLQQQFTQVAGQALAGAGFGALAAGPMTPAAASAADAAGQASRAATGAGAASSEQGAAGGASRGRSATGGRATPSAPNAEGGQAKGGGGQAARGTTPGRGARRAAPK